MNNERRKKLSAVWSELESIIEEEQEAVDNLSGNLEGSHAAMSMEGVIDTLEEAKDLIGDIAGEF